MRAQRVVVVLLSACIALTAATRSADTECALFTSTDSYVFRMEDPAWIKIGTVDVGYYFSVSMDILVGETSSNGQLFGAANKDPFAFYEWPPTVGTKTVCIAMELTYGAVASFTKRAGGMYGASVEVFNTWPEPYTMHDGAWHRVVVARDDHSGTFNVSVDHLTVTRPLEGDVDIQIEAAPAYLGGRPGYTDFQFGGVIKNLQVNGYDVTLGDKEVSNEHVEIVRCSSTTATDFIRDLYADTYYY